MTISIVVYLKVTLDHPKQQVNGKKIRGRQYPWGVVEVENPKHCDFVKIRSMLITHMQDLQVSPGKKRAMAPLTCGDKTTRQSCQ